MNAGGNENGSIIMIEMAIVLVAIGLLALSMIPGFSDAVETDAKKQACVYDNTNVLDSYQSGGVWYRPGGSTCVPP